MITSGLTENNSQDRTKSDIITMNDIIDGQGKISESIILSKLRYKQNWNMYKTITHFMSTRELSKMSNLKESHKKTVFLCRNFFLT